MKSRDWVIGVAVGAAVGLAVAAAMTFLDWRLNPGGIFHGAEGTDWGIVRETAVSWLVPVAGLVTVLAWLVLFLLSRRR